MNGKFLGAIPAFRYIFYCTSFVIQKQEESLGNKRMPLQSGLTLQTTNGG